MTADDVYAEAARPRAELLAELEAAETARPWVVVLQGPNGIEHQACDHRWERLAERCARRLTADADQLGIRYIVRRAES